MVDISEHVMLERIAAQSVLGVVDWRALSAWAAIELSRAGADGAVLDLAILTDPDSAEISETLQRVLEARGVCSVDCARAATIELAETAIDVVAGTDDVLSAARRLDAVWARMPCAQEILDRLHDLVYLYDEPFETEPNSEGDLRELHAYFLALALPN